MSQRTISVTGAVVWGKERAARPALRVEIWDADRLPLVDATLTDANGRFEVHLDEEYLEQLYPDGLPELFFFRVFKDRQLLASTEETVTWSPGSGKGHVRILVDPGQPVPGREGPAPYGVRGQVVHAVEGPAAEHSVKVYDRNLARHDDRDDTVGEATTGRDGRYHISYHYPREERGAKIKADLVVHAYDPAGKLVAEEFLCHAPTTATVNLTFGGERYPGPSDFERLSSTIDPHLSSAGVDLARIPEEELEHLACSSGAELSELEVLHRSARVARSADLPAELVYGLAKEGVAPDLRLMVVPNAEELARTLDRAFERNRIPGRLRAQRDKLLSDLRAAVVRDAFEAPSQPGRFSLGDLLGTSLVSREQQRGFLAAYLERTGSEEEFWEALSDYPSFEDPHAVEELRYTVQLATLFQGNLPHLRVFRKLREDGKMPGSLREWIGKVDAAELESQLREAAGGFEVPLPAHIRGETLDEKVSNYVAGILEPVRAAFPGATLRQEVFDASDTEAPLKVFLSNTRGAEDKPELDLISTRLDRYLADHSEAAFQGIPEEERGPVVAKVQAMQRIARVTPRADHVRGLLEAGIDSALAITRTPRKRFVQRFGDLLGGEHQAELVHSMGQKKAAAAQIASIATRQALEHLPYAIVGNDRLTPDQLPDAPILLGQQQLISSEGQGIQISEPQAGQALPDWKILFGQVSFCECKHCRSVYSPAAYFVDLLHMLDVKPGGSKPRPVDVLFSRRPDLQHILLTCANTNTQIPYIDLVNEALESYVFVRFVQDGDPTKDLQAFDTGEATAGELRAVPQNVIAEAYEELQKAVSPMDLPFHRPLAVARAYLEQLGTSRLQVMETFRTGALPTEEQIAAEVLGLSPEQAAIIMGEPLSNQPTDLWAYYGYAFELNPAGKSWTERIAHVPEFLRKTAIAFEDLVELVKTRFLNADGGMLLQAEEADCDLEKMTIPALDEARLARVHRFIRLWRQLAWSIADLDRVLYALGAADIDPATLGKLAALRRLEEGLDRPVVELLALLSNIDTWGDDPLYARLFQNRAVARLEDSAAFELAADKLDLEDPAQSFDEHVPAVLAALRITQSDLETLRSAAELEKNQAQEDALNLANLSALYRHVVLARGLGLRVTELLSLIELTPQAVRPFTAQDPHPTLAFVDKARRVQRSNFSLAQLDYLYRHLPADGSPPAPSPEQVTQTLRALRGDLLKVQEETAVPEVPDPNNPQSTLPDDPTGELVRARLAMAFEEEAVVEQAMGLVVGDETRMPADDRQAFVQEKLSKVVDPSQAAAELIHPLPLSEERKRDNIAYLLSELVPWLRATLSRSVVVQTLAAAVALEDSLVRWLLESAIQGRVKPGETAMADLLALVDEEEPAPAHSETYEILNKAALLISGFGMSEREVVHLSQHSQRFADFDLDALPLSPPPDPAELFVQWERLQDLSTLKANLPEDGLGLFDLFELEPEQLDPLGELAAKLAAVAGWDAAEVVAIAGSDGLAFADEDFRTEEKLVLVKRCLDLVRRAGVSAEKLFAWAEAVPAASDADDVVSAVKARYEHQQWLEVARTLNDALRETQRSALVAYMLPRMTGIDTADQLFEHFLIDVEMTSCMLTSRIKQAISSVQLFVQRCHLNLEHAGEADQGVDPDAIDGDQWKWRKHYRVWEANRKVFLYPENWIEPELRLGKSPFFKELEGELLQNDLTEENVERAFLGYLEKLNEVARLDVVAMYWQVDSGADVLHVFGRTFDKPSRYYYRRLLYRREWTPWERVDLDIDEVPGSEGSHLIPVVYNRRLYLFWPIFTETQSQGLFFTKKYWEVRFAWSPYRQGRWGPRRSIEGTILEEAKQDDISDYIFRTARHYVFGTLGFNGPQFVSGGQLEIRAYRGSTLDYLGDAPFEVCHARFNDLRIGPNLFFLPAVIDENRVAKPKGDSTFFMQYRSTSDLAVQRARTMDVSLVLKNAPGHFFSTFPHQRATYPHVKGFTPFFVRNGQRAYFVEPLEVGGFSGMQADRASLGMVVTGGIGVEQLSLGGSGSAWGIQSGGSAKDVFGSSESASGQLGKSYNDVMQLLQPELRFKIFQHPHVCTFIKELERGGIDGLLTLANQQLAEKPMRDYFKTLYDPTLIVERPLPVHNVDFEFEGAYSLYNWELFFHIPLLIATRLSNDQRHEEAQRWFHYIFDPTTDSSGDIPARFWKVRRFHEEAVYASVQDLLGALHDENASSAEVAKVRNQIADWIDHPFEPHRVARLRTVAYQKTVVMKYIDNLIDWGDRLFRRDTIESINEATQLYVLAARILGRRPQGIPPMAEAGPKTYGEIRDKLGEFSNVQVENLQMSFPYSLQDTGDSGSESVSGIPWLYFCIPNNAELLEYWDRVEDRLFKIRHCLNIEGVARELSLFEPPIDPALLVRARAMGIDLSSVIADLHAPLPHYRFTFTLPKALELANELKPFGQALLSALEKKDAEALATLHAEHQGALQRAVRDVRAEQIKEAETTRGSLKSAQEVTKARWDYYRLIKDRNIREEEHLAQLELGHQKQEESMGHQTTASFVALIPDITIPGGVTGPNATFGGSHLASLYRAFAQEDSMAAAEHANAAVTAATLGGWDRRSDDWGLQETLAALEYRQIDEQILAADIRIDIAKKELAAQDKQVESAKEVRGFLKDKYTDEELYGWMIQQVSQVYFQAYKLTYDMAKRAERTYRFERGLTSSDFIKFGYWDSMKKGLLAADGLALDLRRLEAAYLQENRREYEITKHVSFVLHDPGQLIRLKETGECAVELPEVIFDADYPGHYFRRLKSVSISIPCVTGPYTGINCTLTLLASKIRTKSLTAGGYAEDDQDPDPRFLYDFAAVQSIATSDGRNDPGLFELNFRDERYLPFEGAGAISRWRIDLPRDSNAFDFGTISDIVLTLNYTAREGGQLLRQAAKDARDELWGKPPAEDTGPKPPLQRLFGARHEFPGEWQRLLKPTDPQAGHVLEFTLTPEHFPYRFRGKTPEAQQILLYVKAKEGIETLADLKIDLEKGTLVVNDQALAIAPSFAQIPGPVDALGSWSLKFSRDPVELDDLWILLIYSPRQAS